MNKKTMLFVVLLLMLLICIPANAQKAIGVFLTAPNAITKDADQIDRLEARLMELFPADRYNILPIRQMLVREADYRKRMNIFQSPNQLNPPALSKEALCELGKENRCDYVILIQANAAEVKKKWDFSVGTNAVTRMNLLTELIITDTAKQTEVFRKQYKNRGVDKVYMFNTRAGDAGKAVVNAFNKFLEELIIIPGKDIP